jgi:predicted nucleic acid-binding protein
LENVVLDSYALLAFLFKEPGYETIVSLFEKALEEKKSLLIAAPNWAEVRYIVERKRSSHAWTEVRAKLLGLPIKIINADEELAEEAGKIKAEHRMSLADGFAAALAKQRKAHIYTGAPEFKCLETALKIVWL